MSKLKSIAKTTAFAAVLGLSGWVAYDLTRPPYDGNAGITYGSAAAPIRGTDVDFNIWYPALPGGKSVTVGGNGVFYGTPAGRDAPHQAGRFPMVVISHGAGGKTKRRTSCSDLADVFLFEVAKLIETLNVPEHRAEAADVVRSMVEKIVLTPDAGENRLVSDLHGSLAGILGMATKEKAHPQLTDSAIAKQIEVIEGSRTRKGVPEDALQVKLVAGVGFEPTTFRL